MGETNEVNNMYARDEKTVKEALAESKIVLMVVINDDAAKIRVLGKTYEIKDVLKYDCKCRWDGENKEWYKVVSLDSVESALTAMLADVRKGARKFAKIDECDVNAYNLPAVDKANIIADASAVIADAKATIATSLETVAAIATHHNQSAVDAVAYHCLETLTKAAGDYDIVHPLRKAMHALMTPTPASTVSLGSGITKYVAPNAATWTYLQFGELAELTCRVLNAPNKELFLRALTGAANGIQAAVTKIRKLDAKLAASTIAATVKELMDQYCPNVKM